MNNRRIALGLGTGAGALLGAALLSGLTSPIAAADDYAIEPVTTADLSNSDIASLTGDATTNPYDTTTAPAFLGLGTDTTQTEVLANYDTTTPELADVSGATTQATGEFGAETVETNTYSTPLFIDTSTDVTAATGSLASNLGTTDDTFWIAPEGTDIIGYDTGSQEILTPDGDYSLTSLLDGTDLTSLLGGTDLTSLLGGGDGLGSLLTGGDLLTGLDPSSLMGLF
jgi:hypothetical protein